MIPWVGSSQKAIDTLYQRPILFWSGFLGWRLGEKLFWHGSEDSGLPLPLEHSLPLENLGLWKRNQHVLKKQLKLVGIYLNVAAQCF